MVFDTMNILSYQSPFEGFPSLPLISVTVAIFPVCMCVCVRVRAHTHTWCECIYAWFVMYVFACLHMHVCEYKWKPEGDVGNYPLSL